MKESRLRWSWSVAQVAICAGIVCIAVGFAKNVVGVVIAQPGCPHQVPLYSLCVTTPFPVCRDYSNPTNTTGCGTRAEWDVKSEWFQCLGMPDSGQICYDSTKFASCYTVYGCHVRYGFCTRNTDGTSQSYSKVTKTWDWCPG